MAELFNAGNESLLLIDEMAREDLAASIKNEYSQKLLGLEELSNLLHRFGVKSDFVFYNWIHDFLSGNSDLNSSLAKDSITENQFKDHDTDSSGSISKVSNSFCFMKKISILSKIL